MKEPREPTTQIPLLDLKAQYHTIRDEVRQAIDEVLESQHFILGPAVRRFEEEAASFLQCRATIGVASGSDALLLSLMALGIGSGDAVVVPPFTFFSTASAITRVGATPIFVDIDPESCLIDLKALAAIVDGRCQPHPKGPGLLEKKSHLQVKAILPVHLFGQSCPMGALLPLTEKYHLWIIEDVAQAFGAWVSLPDGVSKAAGTVGGVGCFSFFPSKILGGVGDGGLVATNHSELAEKIRMLRVHGQNSKYHHQLLGINSRLDSIQAAVLSVKLRYIERWCAERIERARLYQDLFAATGLVGDRIIGLPSLGTGKSHVFNYYVVRVQRRDELRGYLAEHGIQTEVYYPLPLHLQPSFAQLGYHTGDLPNAELVSSQVLALPMYPELAPKGQEVVVQKIVDFYRQ